MARPAFKRLWTRLVPRPLERSTFVLFASLLLLLLFWQWRPMTGTLWDLRGSAAGTSLSALFLLGWLVVLLATGMVDHWDLFGLRQVWDHLKGRGCTHPPFQTRGFYRYLRHPIMLGFLIAFWATPHLTSGHLLFALATSSSIFLGIALEERDLLAQLGPAYREYRRQVSMIVPWRARSGSGPPDGSRD